MKNAAGRIKVDLSELYDLLESKLMALESLGRTKEKFAEFLEPLVESCLPETVLRAWERSRSVEDSSPQNSARSLDKLLCFLRNEVRSEEIIKLARTGLGVSRVSHPLSLPDEPDCSTAAALENFQDNSEHNGKELKVRTILDSGSQKSYIFERVIKLLKLRPKSKQTITHSLFGGRETSPHSHLVFDVYLKNFEDTFAHLVEVLSQKKICGFVPKIVDLYTLQELKEKNITLSDLETKEHDIELLLGADVIGNILTGNSLKLSSDVTVVQTKFGYTVIEKTNTIYNNLYSNVVSLHCANFTVTDLWNLDAIGITDPSEDAKRKHAHSDFLNQFKENSSVLPDGRYELPLPFKFETQLPNNKSATIKRHKRMCQRIDEQNQLNDYEATYLSENSDDLVPLSPAMFLVENRNLDVPDIDYRDTVNLRKRDGKIRTVELKTRAGTMLRPIQRVYFLEVQSTETPDDPLNDCTFTNPISSISSDMLSDPNDSSSVLPRVSRYGRVIKAPKKLDLFNQALYVFESK
ncbi:putative RNA-directed DNA polymerase from transposon X-element [Trichonephila inaurata madagascariensis]|uniref:Putative RNA-directed DNA polymerase from transposon X-element n=1 Tax=Trichonephila inaurata madagascariensis TaxID=2747483 RepID=A0A8X6YCM6_9ARAC|nr:putative RNA-directed DNA polymerase from transposon X-element [Trichonephila inaurata madagascariensis]